MLCDVPAEIPSRVVPRRIQLYTSLRDAANDARSPKVLFGDFREEFQEPVKDTSAAACDDDTSTIACSTLSRAQSLEFRESEDEDSASSVCPWTPSPGARGYRPNLSSRASVESDSEDEEAWRRMRTPSPETTYCSMGGRSLPPPSLLIVPVRSVPMTPPPSSPPSLARQQALVTECPEWEGISVAPPSPAACGSMVQDEVDSSEMQPGSTPTLSRTVSWTDELEEHQSDADVNGMESQEDKEADPDCVAEGSEDPLLSSVGAAGHAAGTCRPCAHVWRASGCSKGRDCTYCHSCGEKQWRKYKRQYRLFKQDQRKGQSNGSEQKKE